LDGFEPPVAKAKNHRGHGPPAHHPPLPGNDHRPPRGPRGHKEPAGHVPPGPILYKSGFQKAAEIHAGILIFKGPPVITMVFELINQLFFPLSIFFRESPKLALDFE
jgi:hypothetical protein